MRACPSIATEPPIVHPPRRTAEPAIRDVLSKIRIESGFRPPCKRAPESAALTAESRIRVPSFRKLRSGEVPTAGCVLFGQHSPEKDQWRR
jgi:hypothetical protein